MSSGLTSHSPIVLCPRGFSLSFVWGCLTLVFLLSDEYPCMRSIELGMTSGIQSRLDLSPEAS